MSSEPLDMYGITQPESVSRREGMKALARIASRVAWARLALDPAKGELRPDTAKECLDEVAEKIKIVRAALAYPAPTGSGLTLTTSDRDRLHLGHLRDEITWLSAHGHHERAEVVAGWLRLDLEGGDRG